MESGKHNRRGLGQEGEDMACRLLEERGHTIRERNWRSGQLEIDIISYNPDGIHFVEVKTRRSNIQAPPQDNVDRRKQQRISKAANAYLRTAEGLRFRCVEYNFDIVAVTFSHDGVRMDFIEQAYIPIYL